MTDSSPAAQRTAKVLRREFIGAVPAKPAHLRPQFSREDDKVGNLRLQIPPARHHRELLRPQPSNIDGAPPSPGITIRSPTLPVQSLESSQAPSSIGSTSDEDDQLLHLRIWMERGVKPSGLRKEYLRPAPLDHNDIERDIFLNLHDIPCKLATTYNGKTRSFEYSGRSVCKESTPLPGFKWLEKGSYDLVKQRCFADMARLKSILQAKKPGASFKIYLRHGSCSVQGRTDHSRYNPEISTFSFDEDRDILHDGDTLHEVAIKQICHFIATFPNQSFVLVLYCDYGSIEDSSTTGTFQELMWRNYEEKLVIPAETFNRHKYISHADINALTTAEISDRLIDYAEDCGNLEDKQALKDAIANKVAQTLLAVCVHQRISIKQFRHFLLDHDFSDGSLTDWNKKECLEAKRTNVKIDHDFCKHQYKLIEEGKHKFFAHNIEEDRWFHERGPLEVVPISKTGSSLGEGSFSDVWEVRIDVTHRAGQSLSADRDAVYALKIFKKLNTKAEERMTAFRNEIGMLLKLALYPHPHILTHITSWVQDGEYYILYEKARCNLRHYMEPPQEEGLSKSQILWFLTQLHGLADAVRKVHTFKEPSGDISPILTPIRSNQRSRTRNSRSDSDMRLDEPRPKRSKRTGIVGYHHDIKPENVLVFERRGQLPVLKLSDFGAGKFSSVKNQQHTSHRTSGVHGTHTYRGPEAAIPHYKKGRLFDMWALGCLFTEFLLWFLDIKHPLGGDKEFATLRLEASNADVDYYWQKRLKGNQRKSHKKSKSQPEPKREDSTGDELRHKTVHAERKSLNVPDPTDEYELNESVEKILNKLEFEWCLDMPAFSEVVKLIRGLLKIRPDQRLDSLNLANSLDAILAQAERDLLDNDADGDNFYRETFYQNMTRPRRRHPAPSGLPAQLSQAQPYQLDVSTTGTSRRRSLAELPPLTALRSTYAGTSNGEQHPPHSDVHGDSAGLGSAFLGTETPIGSFRVNSGDESHVDSSPSPNIARKRRNEPLPDILLEPNAFSLEPNGSGDIQASSSSMKDHMAEQEGVTSQPEEETVVITERDDGSWQKTSQQKQAIAIETMEQGRWQSSTDDHYAGI